MPSAGTPSKLAGLTHIFDNDSGGLHIVGCAVDDFAEVPSGMESAREYEEVGEIEDESEEEEEE